MTDITNRPPLLTPQHVQILTDHLAKIHGSIADVDRIERCGFECGDLRATLGALGNQISTMLAELGNVPQGMIPQIKGTQPRPLVPTATGY